MDSRLAGGRLMFIFEARLRLPALSAFEIYVGHVVKDILCGADHGFVTWSGLWQLKDLLTPY